MAEQDESDLRERLERLQAEVAQAEADRDRAVAEAAEAAAAAIQPPPGLLQPDQGGSANVALVTVRSVLRGSTNSISPVDLSDTSPELA